MKNEYQYKFHIEDKNALIEKLRAKNIELTKPMNHTYTYFKPLHKIKSSFAVIRVRESEKEKILDMKIRNNKTEKWDRFESKIENSEQVIKILEAIGCKAMVIFRKTRQTYINDFLRLDVDTLRGMGTFLEVKFKAGNKEKAEHFLKQFGIDPLKHDKRSVIEIYFSRQN